MLPTLRAAVIQMVSTTSPEANIRTMQRLVRQAAEGGARWAVLPEYWPLMGRRDTDKCALAEPFGQGVLQEAMSRIAEECGLTLFGGSIPLAGAEAGKVFNSLLVYAADGRCVSRYDKVHLFGYTGQGERYAEADTISAGTACAAVATDGWQVAQGICYDLRFPEFFRRQLPFQALVLPAAFTYPTGLAHWSLLLRARAVENQCYVLASAQGGRHENGRRTFGHSMVVDPWGGVLAELPEGEGVVLADLDGSCLHDIRTRLPALSHRVF